MFWLVGKDVGFNEEDEAKVNVANLCQRSIMTSIQDRHEFTTLTLASFLFHCGHAIMGHVWYISEAFYDLICLLFMVYCWWIFLMNVVVIIYLKDEFIIYYVIWVFFQFLTEYITFQIALANYNTID